MRPPKVVALSECALQLPSRTTYIQQHGDTTNCQSGPHPHDPSAPDSASKTMRLDHYAVLTVYVTRTLSTSPAASAMPLSCAALQP